MNKLIIILISIIAIKATSIVGQGYGNNERESLKDALSDLSNRISVNVKSNSKTYTSSIDDKYKKTASRLVDLSSSLPIKGAEFEILNSPKLTKTIATLSSDKSLKIYKNEIKRLQKDISHSLLELQGAKNTNLKYKILSQILSDIDSFQKHKIVAILLGAKNLPSLNVNTSEIKTKLQKLEIKISNMELASKILTKDIKHSDIYISAFKINGSPQITQFARVFKKLISKHLDISEKPVNARYFLRGNYEVLKNSIFINITLSDTYNKIVKSTNISLDKKAYKHLKYKASSKSFDESLNSGFIKSDKLFTQIGFKGFNRVNGIDLQENDEIDIVVKSNKSICYFIIGYVLKKQEKFSYLLPIGSDNSPFINYITGDDVNRNITIASDIPITKPFGNETLQIFSASISKKNKCSLRVPKCKDNDDGLCVIKGKMNKVMSQTRALNISKKKFKTEKSESSISWTSFKK